MTEEECLAEYRQWFSYYMKNPHKVWALNLALAWLFTKPEERKQA